MTERISCADCGRFISEQDMATGKAKHRFEPDSHFGPEVSEWICALCRRGSPRG